MEEHEQQTEEQIPAQVIEEKDAQGNVTAYGYIEVESFQKMIRGILKEEMWGLVMILVAAFWGGILIGFIFKGFMKLCSAYLQESEKHTCGNG